MPWMAQHTHAEEGNTMKNRKHSQASKVDWMRTFEAVAVERGVFEAGRVCWDTATFFWHSGLTPYAAIQRMIDNRQEG